MGETIYNMGNHLKTGEWVIYGVCRTCGVSYIIQTNQGKPEFCPVCGKELGELYAIEEDADQVKHEGSKNDSPAEGSESGWWTRHVLHQAKGERRT